MKNSLNQILESYKDPKLVYKFLREIKELSDKLKKPIKIMEFCGGHTHSLLRFGLDEALKGYIEFLHGPGCPVCVLGMDRIEYGLQIAQNKEVIFTTYGDLFRVPNLYGISLVKLRAQGWNIKMLSHAMEALKIAQENPQKLVVFYAIGFETTAPATAFLLERAKVEGISNLKVISNHMLTPAVLDFLFSKKGVFLDGIIGPGHVSAVIGAKAFEAVMIKYNLPMVIAGFEPLDLVQAIKMLVEKIKDQKKGVFIAYSRAVTYEGNKKAQEFLKRVFYLREVFPWRGLGEVPKSGLALKEEYKAWDGELLWEIPKIREVAKGCICGIILQGKAKPIDCVLFGKTCKPDTPIGPCMVSSEGACLAYIKYKGPLF